MLGREPGAATAVSSGELVGVEKPPVAKPYPGEAGGEA